MVANKALEDRMKSMERRYTVVIVIVALAIIATMLVADYRLGSIEARLTRLEKMALATNARVTTNKHLMKATMRMVVPDERLR